MRAPPEVPAPGISKGNEFTPPNPKRPPAGAGWASTARDSEAFSIDGVLMLAVASSDVAPESTGGAATIYRWSGKAFELVQATEGDAGASSLAYFRLARDDGPPRTPKPCVRNPKPETRNLEPETRNQKPETRNPNNAKR